MEQPRWLGCRAGGGAVVAPHPLVSEVAARLPSAPFVVGVLVAVVGQVSVQVMWNSNPAQWLMVPLRRRGLLLQRRSWPIS